ncbi:MAG: hypothetical protein LBV52_05925 [Spirochaetaceae bacterium]|jgi:hypothetical protein|nr:hypothetical protein [Spirochaetaceae bacterium]
MSDSSEFNLYQSPENEAKPVSGLSGSVLSANSLNYLKGASPWLRFIAIISFISCGFMLLSGIIFIISGAAVGNIAAEVAESAEPSVNTSAFTRVGLMFSGVAGFFYVGCAVLSFFPAKFLWTFGSKLRDYVLRNSELDLEIALKNNKSFWKFAGIVTIVCIAILPITFIVTMVVVATSVMH